MPDNAILTPNVVTRKIEVIEVTLPDQIIYVDPVTGATIAVIVPQAVEPSPNVYSPPILTFEKLLEFEIRRFGIKHSDVDLRALRQLVELVGADRPEGLRIADLNGWSGEIALALCRQSSFDVVTIVDNLMPFEREMVENLGELLVENLGELLGSRIQWALRDPMELTNEVDDYFDIIFVDSAATPERLRIMLNAWLYHLSPGGCIVGSFQTDERLAVVKHEFAKVPVRSFGDSLWLVTAADLFDDGESETAADDPAEATTGD